MTKTPWPRGSEWRKWDLHVHTPASFQWKGSPRFEDMNDSQKTEWIEDFTQRIESSDIQVWGIQDYWTFDGYLEIKRLLDHHNKKISKTILPGMELRFPNPTKNGRTDIHVLLSDELTDQQLLDFSSKIELELTDRALSKDAIIQIPQRLAEDKLRLHDTTRAELRTNPEKAYQVGAKTAVAKLDSIINAVKHQNGNALLIVPFDTYHGLEELNWKEHPVLITKIMQSGDLFEVRKQTLIDCFQGRKEGKPDALVRNFITTLGKPKPPVSGSDAHRLSDYGTYPTSNDGITRATWIKCDPTYRGLRSAMCEAGRRFFIGAEPEELRRVRQGPRDYIDRISIKPAESAPKKAQWFDVDIPISSGVVAIIGNKGSGKSALADTIGLLGNSKHKDKFSFLTPNRFRSSKNGKAQHYQATIHWKDGSSNSTKLSDNLPDRSPERVKFLPQSYIETICNEIEYGEDGAFDRELKSVIYSHIPEHERLGKSRLNDIIREHENANDVRSQQIRGEIRTLNRQIQDLEWETSQESITRITEHLGEARKRLEAHESRKPAQPPEDDSENNRNREERRGELFQLREDIDEYRAKQRREQQALRSIAHSKVGIGKILSEVRSLEDTVSNVASRIFDIAETINIPSDVNLEGLIHVKIDAEPLVKLLEDLAKDEADGLSNLSATNQKIDELESQRTSLASKLERHQREEEEYLQSLEKWNEIREGLLGSAEVPRTIRSYEKKLADATGPLLEKLIRLKEARVDLARRLHQSLVKTVNVYKELYGPVQRHIEEQGSKAIPEEYGFQFSVDIEENGFLDGLVNSIDRRRKGIQQVIDSVRAGLSGKTRGVDFSNEDEVVSFIQNAELSVREVAQGSGRELQDLLRSGSKAATIYDHLYLLEYLRPRYKLMMHNRPLAQLSPGERGALLLVFYLLVDNKDTPIIIDQPEENLDNMTVYRLLGQCINSARDRRQIIFVTHNPNLAVACDADQVIVASHNRHAERITYISGSLEDEDINHAVMDILEGTRPAFENRDSKYYSKRGDFE